MADDIFSFLRLEGGFAERIFYLLRDTMDRAFGAPELEGAIGYISSVCESSPIPLALTLLFFSILILLCPTYAPKPLSILYSALAGFTVTVAYFPRLAAEELPVIVVAAIVGVLALIFHRLVSLLTYFAAVGIIAYSSAYLGYLFGFGKGDVFLSLLLTAAVILVSLLLITPIRILGITLFGGLLFSLALSVVIDLSLIFGEGACVAVAVNSVFFALLSLYRLAHQSQKGGKNKTEKSVSGDE